MAAGLHKGKG